MLIQVGDLAKRSGLTVRALHHYDRIGLLSPSGRSDGGYRLYNRDDVARLHGILTLRRMGLSLAEVAQWLDAGATALPTLLARQVEALEREIAQRQALHERLLVMQSMLAEGQQPELDDWLGSLSMMGTLERYFSAGELRAVLESWKRCAAEWPPLVQAVQEAMARGLPPDAPALQPLARRWMDVSARWMNGDMALLQRWGLMLREQPGLPLPSGMDRALLDYIQQAVQRRLAALGRHLTAEELQRLDKTLQPEWTALIARAARLVEEGVPPQAPAARRLSRAWQRLLDRVVRHDAALREKLLTAFEREPLLQAGAEAPPEVWRYLRPGGA